MFGKVGIRSVLVILGISACGEGGSSGLSGPPVSLELSPKPVSVQIGQTRQVAATGRDQSGTVVTPTGLTWTSRNTAVARVDGQGIVTGVSAGSTVVVAETASLRDSTTVNVTAGPGGGTTAQIEFLGSFGGSGEDWIRDVTTDAQGNLYVTGGTLSPNFPTTAGAVQRTHNPGGAPQFSYITRSDVFVAKISPSGQVIWSTLLGGPNHDRAYGIEVDAQGSVYIAGRAGLGFPVTANAFQTAFQGGEDAQIYGPQDGFVCKLRQDGGAVIFCSYFGTTDGRPIRDLAVDASGSIYIASGRISGNYPAAVASAFRNAPVGGEDAVLAKIRADGGAVLWAMYVGGSNEESHQNSVRLDGNGNPYLLLTTNSSNAPATAGAYQRTYGGGGDLLVVRANPSTGAIVWASYLGGSQNESTETHEFAVDPSGNAYVVAPTQSANFPTTAGAFQRTFGGVHDIFVAKLSPDGARLLASTFVGGSDADRPEGAAVDGQGVVSFTGTSTSTDFPLTPDAFQTTLRGGRDAVAVRLSSDFSRLLYSSYFGGSGIEYGRGAAVGNGVFYFGGETTSPDFPKVAAPQATYGGNADAFVARLNPGQ